MDLQEQYDLIMDSLSKGVHALEWLTRAVKATAANDPVKYRWRLLCRFSDELTEVNQKLLTLITQLHMESQSC